MEFNIKDSLSFSLVMLFIIILDILLLILIYPYISFFPSVIKPIFVFIFFIVFFHLMIGPVYNNFLRMIWKPGKAEFKQGQRDIRTIIWGQLMASFEYSAAITQTLIPHIHVADYLSLFGLKKGKGTLIAGLIIEPWMIELGKNVQTGGFSILAGHIITGDKIILGKIKIDDNTQIGTHVVVWPNVKIGKNSVVASGSVVPTGTVIGDYELWAGAPAKKIKDLKDK